MAETRSVWEPLYGHALADEQIVEIVLLTDELFDSLYNPQRRTQIKEEQ